MSNPGRKSSLAEWLAWLETLHPKKIDLSLNRIRTVLEVLGLEQPAYRIVAVGGTNGKGSCVAYLANIYSQAGYRSGAFTSPHLIDFNERIAVDGINATDAELVDAFVAMDEARDAITLSYFEASAVAALVHFATKQVDVAILEVGMGGRLDAVNAVDSDASLIASIGLDHQEWLGSDRESIGFEKAGIMRPGKPVIIADPDPPQSVRAAARESRADALFVGEDFGVESRGEQLLVRCRNSIEHRVPAPRFGGDEQWLNVAACVQLVDCLREVLPVHAAALASGIAATAPVGRADRRHIDGVEWVFDVAHNPAAAQRLASTLRAAPSPGRTLAVFGALRDKDVRGVLAQFAELVDDWHVITPSGERAAPAADIASTLQDLGTQASFSAHENIRDACEAARTRTQPGDRVVVFGSFYVVGPALSALELYFHSPD